MGIGSDTSAAARAAPEQGVVRSVHPRDVRLVRSLVLRGLALTQLAAFASLWVQIEGLIGPHGILPASAHLRLAEAVLGDERFYQVPTLLWWLGASATSLHALCAAGVLAALFGIAGWMPRLSLLLSWLLYLSLVHVGQDFLSFQWDSLLLEAMLVAFALAPGARSLARARSERVSRLGLWLVRGLVFKLMFLSGVVKLASQDPTWRDWTALEFHYWTTCLPVWTGWWIHKLPGWMHQASVLATFVGELGLPWLLFGPRRVRLLACGGLIGLQCMIAVTGNYGFFNLLSIVLCLAWLDDDAIRSCGSCIPRRWHSVPPAFAARVGWLRREIVAVVLVIIWLPISLGYVVTSATGGEIGVARLVTLTRAVSPLRSINAYGLFASMTTRRREITLEATIDGEHWQEIGFAWKPGEVRRRPGFAGLHMPRLDWQMWFAALDRERARHWFEPLMHGLLLGKPEIRALLADDPFAGAPIEGVRAAFYDYRFTTFGEWRSSGAWWKRNRLGLYAPIIWRPTPP